MKLILGLGNPGKEHENSRHNLGFMAIDKFLMDFEPLGKTTWDYKSKLKSDIAIIDYQPQKGKEERAILAKPRTYMNLSGLAAAAITSYYGIRPQDVFVIHDEIDLPAGTIRIRFGGASAGHKGVVSIIESLGTDKFWRIRLGIGNKKNLTVEKGNELGKRKIAKQRYVNTHDYVLGPFSKRDMGKVRIQIKKTSQAIFEIFEHGVDSAMNKFNTR